MTTPDTPDTAPQAPLPAPQPAPPADDVATGMPPTQATPAEPGEAPGHGIGITEAAPPAAPKKSVAGLWVWLAIIVVCCGYGIFKALDNKDDQDSPEARGVDAELVCQDFVKDRLKAPSTAKFSGVDHSGYDRDWTVTGAVDSQNSFGAMIRNNFTCKLQLNEDATKWHLVSLTGLNN